MNHQIAMIVVVGLLIACVFGTAFLLAGPSPQGRITWNPVGPQLCVIDEGTGKRWCTDMRETK